MSARLARYALVAVAATLIADFASAQPAASNWALAGADQQRTGRSGFAASLDGALQWKLKILDGSEPHTAGAVIGADGAIFIGTMDRDANRGMYAVNPDGTIRWQNSGPTRIARGGAVLHDGSVIALSRNHAAYRFAPDGSTMWFSNPDVSPIRDYFSAPNIGDDGTIYATRQNSGLFAFNPDGSLKWTASPGLDTAASPAIHHNENIIYAGADGYVRAVNPTGAEQWSFNIGENPITASPIVTDTGSIIIGTETNGLFALNENGTLLWHRSDITGLAGRPAVAADGTIAVAAADNTLWSLAADGTTNWSFSANEGNTAIKSSPIVDAHGNIFASLDTNRMYAFDSSGAILFEYATGGAIFAPGALSEYGTLYFGSTDGYLYAIGTPVPAPSTLVVLAGIAPVLRRRRNGAPRA